ncbi:hypothetical protein [Bacteroides fluxus]|nr:hypothetical protein [Bacteroides fluxus]MDY3790332.1 hypothetical protein [Bacteroides fluxus]
MTANRLPSLAITVAVTPQIPMNREVQSGSDGVTAKYEKTPCRGSFFSA